MIFYFTGTGNSYAVAKRIANLQGESLYSIAKELDHNTGPISYEVRDGEKLGFVYPVYAWGPPEIVLEFISRLKITGEKPYVFSVGTCGDEEGNSTSILKEHLLQRGFELDSAFSVRMPNNYVIGADVDPKDVEKEKIRIAELKCMKIDAVLSARQSGVFHLIPGRMPRVKSSVANPLFNRYGRNTKYFTVTAACNGCGLCEDICPVHSISVNDRPSWGKACTQCLGCLHRCPAQAIQLGKGSHRKGRYVHPCLTEMVRGDE